MFNFFKKSHKDESSEDQQNDILRCGEKMSKMCLDGLDCDEIPNATGKFGHDVDNPIPVNGPIGEIKYIGRLGTRNGGISFIFHRLGSITSSEDKNPVDVFEIVSIDGKVWDIIYIDMYHPRRSTKTPEGYRFRDFHEIHSRLPIGYGTLHRDHDFPFNIGRFIERDYDIFGNGVINKRLAKHFDDLIKDKGPFVRPEYQENKVSMVMSLLNATAYFQVKV